MQLVNHRWAIMMLAHRLKCVCSGGLIELVAHVEWGEWGRNNRERSRSSDSERERDSQRNVTDVECCGSLPTWLTHMWMVICAKQNHYTIHNCIKVILVHQHETRFSFHTCCGLCLSCACEVSLTATSIRRQRHRSAHESAHKCPKLAVAHAFA